MDSQELAKKYSNDKYATQKDIKNVLKTNLIDGIWKQIYLYRSNFFHSLSLKHLDSTAYSICYTPKISEKINSVERKLLRLSSDYKELSSTKSDLIFKHNSSIAILKEIAKLYNLNISDEILEKIVKNDIETLEPQYFVLYRYYQCINDIGNFPLKKIDDNTIGDFYSILLGNDNLTEFYRTKEVNNKLARYTFDKIYFGIPYKLIDSNMEQLMTFIECDESSVFVKALCAFYFIYYVKPFETHSEEIAILMLKKILASNDFEEVAAFVNFETLLTNKEELEKVMTECQKMHDLTYLFDYSFDKVQSLIEDSLNAVALSEKQSIKEDFYQPDKINQINEFLDFDKTNNQYKQQLNIDDLNKAIPENEISIEPTFEQPENNIAHTTSVNIMNEVITTPISNHNSSGTNIEKITPNDVIAHNKELENVEITAHEAQFRSNRVEYDQTIAISLIPATLSEEEASKLENRLLEMNPLLTRGQAYFYARHCTIGMSYTIAQYKKEVGCAYETARSSMDGLTSLGYYAKKQLKNKYIYTPIKRN